MRIKLKKYPDNILRKVCSKVTKFDLKLKTLATLMHYSLPGWEGLGLAAPQVGRPICLIVVNTKSMNSEKGKKLTLVNPELLEQSEETFTFGEGCLSFPGKFIKNQRSNKIKVKYQDIDGNENIEEFTELTAFCILHEMDHLLGKLLIDITQEL